MDDRKKHGWRFWFAVIAIMLPVLYVGSFGPACWWFCKTSPLHGTAKMTVAYAPQYFWPLGWVAMHGPSGVSPAIGWYATRRSSVVYVPFNPRGTGVVQLCKDAATRKRIQKPEEKLIL